MKECDNSTRKIHISSNFILSISLLIMFDNLLLRPSLHCNTPLHFTTLHPTTLHYTSPHFTQLHFTTLIDTSLPLVYTSLPSHLFLRIYISYCLMLINPLNPELNPICYLLALLGAHHFLHVSRIRVKSLTLRRLMSYIYGAPILDVSRSHTTTQHSR